MVNEGGLRAPQREPLDLSSMVFWDEENLDKEMRRQFDVCHSCRRWNWIPLNPMIFPML